MEEQPVPFGFIKSNKIYLKDWDGHDARQIGEVREDNIEKSVTFFSDRFHDLEKKINDVIEKIDATENKGSYLMKLVHLKELLPNHDGLGDYLALQEKLMKYENLIRDIINKNRQRNSEIKDALLVEADELDTIINWKEATDKVNDLKTRWIKTGSAEESRQEELEEAFWAKVQKFYDRKKAYFEDKQKLVLKREDQYAALVKEAYELESMHGKERFDKVKELKERWKELGGIPAEKYQPLYDKFKNATNRKPRSFQKPTDLTPILQMLEEVKSGQAPYSKRELDLIKQNLLKDRRRSDDKKRALDLIQLISEKEFILALASKRFADYPKMDADKKRTVKVSVIKDLISRDKEELQTYEENSANFSSSDGSLNRLVSGKIYNQKKKIALKEKLLEMVQSGEF